jgi:hypothetical protein
MPMMVNHALNLIGRQRGLPDPAMLMIAVSAASRAPSRCPHPTVRRVSAIMRLGFGLAVIEVDARFAVIARLAVKIAGPTPFRHVRRQSARLHDPANGQAAPDHGEVVGVALAADHGDAQGDGFVVAQRLFQIKVTPDLSLSVHRSIYHEGAVPMFARGPDYPLPGLALFG